MYLFFKTPHINISIFKAIIKLYIPHELSSDFFYVTVVKIVQVILFGKTIRLW